MPAHLEGSKKAENPVAAKASDSSTGGHFHLHPDLHPPISGVVVAILLA